MSNDVTDREPDLPHRIRTSRRRFLQATGLAAFVPAVSATAAADTTNLTPSTTSGPGRVENLNAYIADPSMFAQGCEPTHVTAAVPYGSVEAARDADEPFTELETRFGASSFVKLLDGDWDFRFYTSPADRPVTEDGTGWESITVPGIWQTQGYDQLIYLNNSITWEGYEPSLGGNLDPRSDIEIPDTNPTATYRRNVEIPADWDGRETFLHFEAVKQAFFVWVDDSYVGYHEGSMTPAEFDITDHVTPGESHDVTLQVYRFSDGEAMETMDMFRFSGVHRSVYLYSTPTVHLRDFHVRSGLDDDYEDGALEIVGEIANYTGKSAGRYEVRAHLYDPTGSKVATLSDRTHVDGEGATVEMTEGIREPSQWSDEHPDLYTVVLELRDGRTTTEAMLDKVGFRTYETTRGQRGAQVLVNGEPVEIRGVNRPESDPETGRTVRLETVKKDMELMKQNNVNAIRTSHYPNDPTFHRLADEYGLYVNDEVGVETHWWQGLAANTEAYHDAMVARFRRMVLRDRNHASIFAWSTGNEAGTGNEHLNMAALAMDSKEYLPPDTSDVTGVSNVETYDGPVEGLAPDRLLYHQPNSGGWDVEYSDMLGPRYPDVGTLLSVADGSYIGDGKRPVVMGEYNHAMGNSLGLVHAMWNGYIQPPVRTTTDITGNDNEGVLVGTPTIDIGDTDGAVTLGENDSIEVDSDDSLGFTDPEFTLAVRFTGVDQRTERDLVTSADRYSLSVEKGLHFAFSVGDGSASVTGKVPSNLATDDWHTLVAVATDDGLSLSLDGDRIAETGQGASSLADDDTEVRIGAGEDDDDGRGRSGHGRGHSGHGRGQGDGHSKHGRGRGHDRGHGSGKDGGSRGAVTVDSVRVFDRALSGDEVGSVESADSAVLGYSFADLLRDKSLQGGFVWAWEDQAVTRTTTVDGEDVEYTFYDDDPFCLNGLVWAEREVQPDVAQLKHSHQPVKVAPTDTLADGEVYVTNHFSFTDLDAVKGRWELVADDETVDEGGLDLDLAPGETRRVTVPFDVPSNADPGTEYWLNVSFTLRDSMPGVDAGHVVAHDQLDVPVDVPTVPTVDLDGLPALDVSGDGDVTVSGDGFEYVLGRDVGTFTSMTYGGTNVVDRGPQFNAWRVPIMNEQQPWGSEQASSWRAAGLDGLTQLVDDVSVSQPADSHVRIEVDGFVQGAGPADLQTTPDASASGIDGTVHGDPETVEGASGTAIAFDGTDDYVEVGDSSVLDFTGPGFTVSATFRGASPGGHQPFVSKGDQQYALKINDSEFSFFIYDGSWTSARGTIPDNLGDGWHTLTGVCESGRLVLYLDGEQIGATEYGVGSVNSIDYPVQIGHNAQKTDRYADVTMDSVRVYDSALSVSEVADQPSTPPENAVLWYGFDEFATADPDERGTGFETRYRYHVLGSGDVVMEVNAAPNDEMKATIEGYLPKMGLQLEAPTALSTFEWYGRGPVETYPDRKWGADIGRYSGSVDDQYVPYIPPTDNGNKADTRWAALSNGDGAGLLGVAGDGAMNTSLNQYGNLDEADHTYQLEEGESIEFNLDDAVTGVGGTPVEPIDEYQVHTNPTSFRMVLRPFGPDDGDLLALARREFPVGNSPDDE